MFEGLYFEYPKVLSFVLIYIACEAYCKIKPHALYFPHAAQLSYATRNNSTLMWILKYLSIVLLVIALMSPVRDEQLVLEKQTPYNVAMVFESSALETRKELIDFVSNRMNDTFALLFYGEQLYSASPLTHNKKSLLQMLKQMQPLVGRKDSHVIAAMRMGIRLLHQAQSGEKLLLLFVKNSPHVNDEERERVVSLLRQERVRLYLIGDTDETSLRELVKVSGGKYFVQDTNNTIESILKEINTMAPSKVDDYAYEFKIYYYLYPLFIAFFTLLIYVYLRNRREV